MAAEPGESQPNAGSSVSDGDRVARAAEALPDAPPDTEAAGGEEPSDPTTPSESEDAPPAAEDTQAAEPSAEPAELEGKTAGQKHAAITKRINSAKRIEDRAKNTQREVEQREARVAEREKHFETLETQLKSVGEGDLLRIIAKARGVEVNDLVRAGIKQLHGSEPEPSAETEKKAKPETDPELKERLDRLERDRQAERERLSALEREKAASTWLQDTAKELSPESHPYLSELPASELSERIAEVASEYTRRVHAETKEWHLPDRADLLAFLEEEEVKADQFWEERRKKRVSRTSTSKDSSAGTGTVKPAPSARTLSNKTASERANGQRQMSERERIAYAAEALQD